jgi:hypothetical protein
VNRITIIILLLSLPVVGVAQDSRYAMSTMLLGGKMSSTGFQPLVGNKLTASALAADIRVQGSLFGNWGPGSDETKKFRMADLLVTEIGMGSFRRMSDVKEDFYFSYKIGLGIQGYYSFSDEVDAGLKYALLAAADNTLDENESGRTIGLFMRWKELLLNLDTHTGKDYREQRVQLRYLLGADRDRYFSFEFAGGRLKDPLPFEKISATRISVGFGFNFFSPQNSSR